MFLPPVLRGPSARFAVQPQKEIPMSASLGSPEGIEQFFFAARENVRDAVAVPEDFGARRLCVRAG